MPAGELGATWIAQGRPFFQVQSGEDPYKMRLTDEEISCIAAWHETQSGFGRDGAATSKRIEAIVARLNSSEACRARVLQDDGLCNYYSLCACPSVPAWSHLRPFQKIDGLLIYLSACAPVGVVSHSRFGIEGTGFEPMEIEHVVDPDGLQGPLEEFVVAALGLHGYVLLTKAEVELPLPPGVKPDEYCLSNPPWNRRFHALFANTD